MSHRQIILVDDDPSTEFFLRKAIKNLDCELLFYDNISEASNAIDNARPKLLIVDMSMTNMDDDYDEFAGLEIVYHIRNRFGDEFPVMVLTGMESALLISKCLQNGADDFHVKSEDFSELAKRIASWLVIDYPSVDPSNRRIKNIYGLEVLLYEDGLQNVSEWRKGVATKTTEMFGT